MRLTCILILLLCPAAFAAKTVEVLSAISAYSKPDFDSPVLFTVEPGTKITVGDKRYGGFRKIKALVDGRSRIGYVTANDLATQNRPPVERGWGVGAGTAYTRLSQGEKTFSLSDSVQYRIESYEGSNVNPGITAQFGQKNFWRMHLSYRTVDLNGTAKTGIAGAQDINVQLHYQMIDLGAQMGWSLFSKVFYAGAGVDVARTISGKVKFGSQDLSNQAEYPDYLSAHFFAGAQMHFTQAISVFVEGRLGAITNQSPMLTVMELGAYLLYWP